MSPLHQVGEAIRNILLSIPLSAARGLFLLFLAALLVWVLTLPRVQTTPPGNEVGKVKLSENLKFWAAVSLVVQLVIYAVM
jgi:hypothetical protein